MKFIVSKDMAAAPQDRPVLVFDGRSECWRAANLMTRVEDGLEAWVYAEIDPTSGGACIVFDPIAWTELPPQPSLAREGTLQ